MKKLGWFLLGAISLLALQALAASLVLARAHGLSARQEPSAIERWIARRARDAALPATAKNRANPAPNTPDVLSDARAHWADHCASCHANDGSGDVALGKHMYPPAPDMRQSATQNLSDGELFYIHPEWNPPDWNARLGRLRSRRSRFLETCPFHQALARLDDRRAQPNGEA